MSLSIDPRRISGVYALGQWFKVVPNTFSIDAYELVDYPFDHVPFGSESDQKHRNVYLLGLMYPKLTCNHDLHEDLCLPDGFNGVCFTDAETDEKVCFSLIECKAFRMISREEAIAEDDRLTPEPGRGIGLHL